MMKITKVFFPILFIVCGCSQLEFVLKNDSSKSFLNNLVVYEVSGENSEYVLNSLIKYFGFVNNENEKSFFLKTKINENIVKTSIDTNQVASEIQYSITINYDLDILVGNCKKFQISYDSQFRHYPKSSGYNFGTDQALQESYQNNIDYNVLQFKNYIETNEDLQNCLNEN